MKIGSQIVVPGSQNRGTRSALHLRLAFVTLVCDMLRGCFLLAYEDGNAQLT